MCLITMVDMLLTMFILMNISSVKAANNNFKQIIFKNIFLLHEYSNIKILNVSS